MGVPLSPPYVDKALIYLQIIGYIDLRSPTSPQKTLRHTQAVCLNHACNLSEFDHVEIKRNQATCRLLPAALDFLKARSILDRSCLAQCSNHALMISLCAVSSWLEALSVFVLRTWLAVFFIRITPDRYSYRGSPSFRFARAAGISFN